MAHRVPKPATPLRNREDGRTPRIVTGFGAAWRRGPRSANDNTPPLPALLAGAALLTLAGAVLAYAALRWMI